MFSDFQCSLLNKIGLAKSSDTDQASPEEADSDQSLNFYLFRQKLCKLKDIKWITI